MKTLISNTFIGKDLLALLSKDNLMIDRDLSRQIYLIIVFMFFAAIPIVFIIRLVVKNDIDKKRLLAQKKREEELKTYVVMIESINRDFRKLKHDMNNVFSTMAGYFNEENFSVTNFQSYFQMVQNEFGMQEINPYPTINLEYIKDPEILGLLLNKMMKAKELKTTFKIEISENIRFPRHLMLELVRIIGILLDNALEESAKADEGYVQIAFINTEQSLLLVKVRNSHSSPQFLNLYKTGGLTSEKGKDRGFGLEIVQDLIKVKKQLHLEFKQNQELVEFSLLIKLKKRSDYYR
ncbi:GHKL domain-containing protein [Enterococcus sp. LJL90]